MERISSDRNIALLIDFENIAAGTEKEGLGKFDIDKVMARIKDKGRILISRSYADWGRFARFKQGLLAANVTMYELTSHGMQDKNRADIAMVVDCLELAYTRDYIDTFVIVSGDSDFTPLVLKLKELNKNVIGVGTRRSTSRLIINACDEFIFYDTIVETKRRKTPTPAVAKVPADRIKAFEAMYEALEGLLREDPTPPLASVLKSAMLRRQPDFNESDIGFSSFTRFLEAARDAGYVHLSRDKKSGGYVVEPPEEAGNGEEVEAVEAAPVRRDGSYDDPYFPEGSEALVRRLQGAGLGAVSASTRMAMLDALVAAVEERQKKRRRVTIPFVQDDIAARLRRTHPDLPVEQIKALLKALMKAGVLLHKDGSPIRLPSAQFTLKKTPEQLNRALVNVYLRQLRADGADLSDRALLAEFFFGDRDRTRDVEEALAWLDVDGAEEEEVSTEAEVPELDDLDAALTVEEEPAVPAPDEAVAAPDDVDLDAVDLDALLVEEEPVVEPPAPKARKRGRGKAEPEVRPEPDPAPILDVDEENALIVDDEAVFEVAQETAVPAAEEAPKAEKTPRRRRGGRGRKKGDGEAAASAEDGGTAEA